MCLMCVGHETQHPKQEMGNSAQDCESPIKKTETFSVECWNRHSRRGCELDAMNQDGGGIFRVCSGASPDDAVCCTETLAKEKKKHVISVTHLVHCSFSFRSNQRGTPWSQTLFVAHWSSSLFFFFLQALHHTHVLQLYWCARQQPSHKWPHQSSNGVYAEEVCDLLQPFHLAAHLLFSH